MPVAFLGFLEPRYHQASGQNLQVSGGQLQVATSCDQWNWPVKIVNVIPIPWWLKIMLEDIGCVAIKHGYKWYETVFAFAARRYYVLTILAYPSPA